MNPCFSSATPGKPEFSGSHAGSNRLLIRAAQPQDLTCIAEILTDSFHSREGLMQWVYPFFRMSIYEDLRHRLRFATAHYVCFVAIDVSPKTPTHIQPAIVGTVEMALRSTHSWPYPDSQYPYVSNLAVRKQSRRQGVAGQLLLACERMAIEWGFRDIYLHVLENNHQARGLYFKVGYRLQQVDSPWHSWLLGQPRRILLRKDLAQRH